MQTTIPIWVSRSKNRFHFIERGERLVIKVEDGIGMKHPRMIITRQFFDYPSWKDVEACRFSINRGILWELKEALSKMEGLTSRE